MEFFNFFNYYIIYEPIFTGKVNNADEVLHELEEDQNICASPSEGLVAVEALMNLISFTPPRVSIRFLAFQLIIILISCSLMRIYT